MKNFSLSEKRFGLFVTKNEKKKKFKKICIVVFSIMITVLTIAIPKIVQCSVNQSSVIDDLNAISSGSTASYWGSVIGGIISGLLTVIGVVLTISYYKKSEQNNRRIEHMPFIAIKILSNKMAEKPNLSKIKIIEKSDRRKEIDKSKIVFLNLDLENIGRDFASILALHIGHNFGGIAYNELIKVNDTVHLELGAYVDDISKGESISFGIQYIDCMTNEYIQEYTIRKDKRIILENGYPKFIGQTHFI